MSITRPDKVVVISTLRINRVDNGAGEEKVQVFDGSRMVFEHIGDDGEELMWDFIFDRYQVVRNATIESRQPTY